MSYLVNATRQARVFIAGDDYSDYFITFTASDGSAIKRGFIETSGSLTLGDKPQRDLLKKYRRNVFRRGAIVTVDIKDRSGVFQRHPRGYLYVIGAAYDPDTKQLSIEIGCRLVLANLTKKIPGDALALSPIRLSGTRMTVQNLQAAFVSAGKFCYQDNQGIMRSGTLFEGVGNGTVPDGVFTSALGYTTEVAKPLVGASPIPDQIKVTYSIPVPPAEDEDGNEDDVIDDPLDGKVIFQDNIADYFTVYPGNVYVRKPPGSEESGTDSEGVVTIVAANAPSTRSDGSPLQFGDIWVNSTTGDRYRWTDQGDGSGAWSFIGNVDESLFDEPEFEFDPNFPDIIPPEDFVVTLPDMGEIYDIIMDDIPLPPFSTCGNEPPQPGGPGSPPIFNSSKSINLGAPTFDYDIDVGGNTSDVPLAGIGGTAIRNKGGGYKPGLYSNVPVVGGSGRDASSTVTVASDGRINKFLVDFPGQGYEVGDTVTVNPGFDGVGAGNGFSAEVLTTKGFELPTYGNGPTGGDAGNSGFYGGGGYTGGGGGSGGCNNNYQTQPNKEFVPIQKRDETRTEYNGPADSVSRVTSTTYAAPVEINRQYYADMYAYCTSLHGTTCNPNGGCPYNGVTPLIKSGMTVRENFYNEDGSIARQVTSNYQTYFSVAQPSDWRASIENGIPTSFNPNLLQANSELFEAVRQTTEYQYSKDLTIQTTTTMTSLAAARGASLENKGRLAAENGITTTSTRRSRGLNINPPRTDSLGQPELVDSQSITGYSVVSYGTFRRKFANVQLSDKDRGAGITLYVDGGGVPDRGSVNLTSGGDNYQVGDTVTLKRASSSDPGEMIIRVTEIGPGVEPVSFEEIDEIVILSDENSYTETPSEAGPFIIEESMPLEVNATGTNTQQQLIGGFKNYVKRLALGESYGMQIGEPLRDELLGDGWVPNLPFRYYDAQDESMLALIMNGTSWGVSSTSAVFSTQGLWVAFTDGQLRIPDNIDNTATPLGFPQKDGGGNTGALEPNPPGGIVVRVEVATPGNGYNTDGVYQPIPAVGGSGYGLTLKVTIEGGVVTEVERVNGGLDYEEGDLVTFSSGAVGGLDTAGTEAEVRVIQATLDRPAGSGDPSNTISVINETAVDQGDFYETIDVAIGLDPGVSALRRLNGGIALEPPFDFALVQQKSTMTSFISGQIVAAGAVLSVESNGGIPLSQQGNIVTTPGDVLVVELFSVNPVPDPNGTNTGNGGFSNLP